MKFTTLATIATTLLSSSYTLADVVYVTQTHKVTQYATVTAGAGQETVVPVDTVKQADAQQQQLLSTWVFSTNIFGQDIAFTTVVGAGSEDWVTLYNERLVIQSGDSLSTQTGVVLANPTTLTTSIVTEAAEASSVAEQSAPVASVAVTLAAQSQSVSSNSPSVEATSKTASTQIETPSTSSIEQQSTSESATPASSTASASSSEASSSSSSSSSSSDFGDVSDEAFSKAILDAHNDKRALHGVSALSWSQSAYDYAQAYADKYSCSGSLTHSGGSYGENLAVGYSSGPAAVDAWYSEGDDYNYSSASTFDHFTAIVWKSTTKVGCAYKDCRSNNWGLYVICSYDPAGNVVGQGKSNVLPLVSS